MKKIIAALLATIAFAAALTGCGGNKNNSKNETSTHSSATSENSKNEDSKSDDKNKVESKADSMTDDAERNGRVRDDDGIIGNEEYENRDDGMTDGMDEFFEGGTDNNSKTDDELL